MKTLHTAFGVEMVGHDGPTGEFREALEAKIVDYGGNTLQGPGEVGTWLTTDSKFGRVPTRVVATKLGRPIASAAVLCDSYEGEQ